MSGSPGVTEVSDVTYVDFVEAGPSPREVLRAEGCEIVIALTHMRVPNDQRLGREVPVSTSFWEAMTTTEVRP
jgi:5'-nucleotidase